MKKDPDKASKSHLSYGDLSREKESLMDYVRALGETNTASGISRMLAKMGGPLCEKCGEEDVSKFGLQIRVGLKAIPDDEDEENLEIARQARASKQQVKVTLRPKRDSVHGYVLKRPSHLYIVAQCQNCGNRFGSMDGRLFKRAFSIGVKRTREESQRTPKRSVIIEP